jgi:hypothetical protein
MPCWVNVSSEVLCFDSLGRTKPPCNRDERTPMSAKMRPLVKYLGVLELDLLTGQEHSILLVGSEEQVIRCDSQCVRENQYLLHTRILQIDWQLTEESQSKLGLHKHNLLSIRHRIRVRITETLSLTPEKNNKNNPCNLPNFLSLSFLTSTLSRFTPPSFSSFFCSVAGPRWGRSFKPTRDL